VLDALEVYSVEAREVEGSIVSDLNTSSHPNTDEEYLARLTANIGFLQQNIEDSNLVLENLHNQYVQKLKGLDVLEEDFENVEEQLIKLAQDERVVNSTIYG
jgi:hypothetical protein